MTAQQRRHRRRPIVIDTSSEDTQEIREKWDGFKGGGAADKYEAGSHEVMKQDYSERQIQHNTGGDVANAVSEEHRAEEALPAENITGGEEANAVSEERLRGSQPLGMLHSHTILIVFANDGRSARSETKLLE